MPIADFNDNTLVAFTNIYRFKELMKNDQSVIHLCCRYTGNLNLAISIKV